MPSAFFDLLLPNPRRLRLAAGLLRLLQRLGIQRALGSSALFCRVPEQLRPWLALGPKLPARFFSTSQSFYPSRGARRLRVALFTGCVMPLIYPEVHGATIRVLQQNGCDVLVPAEQRCCGALSRHAGERSSLEALAQENARVFDSLAVDAVVVNAAGCGATWGGIRR